MSVNIGAAPAAAGCKKVGIEKMTGRIEEDGAMELHMGPRTMMFWFLIPFALCILCDFAGGLLWAEGFSVTQENGLLENSQIFFLALAVCFSIRQGSRTEGGTFRISHAVLGLLFFSVIVREVDIDRLGAAPAWETTEFVIRLVLVLIWVYIGALVYRKRLSFWRFRFRILYSPNSILAAVGILFYVLSRYFDKAESGNQDFNRLWEELLQLNGTIFFSVAALRQLPLSGTVPAHSPERGREPLQ